jgi:hypothetical protein
MRAPFRPSGARHPATAFALGGILVWAVLVRLPVLYNADVFFNSDEAVDALVVKRMLSGGGLSFYNWDATSYGVVEGLLSIPLVVLLGFGPLAFKLTTVLTLAAFVVAVYFLARDSYGPRGGIIAAGAAAVFSPQLVQWTTLASGGYPLVMLCGALGFLVLARLPPDFRPGRTALFGFLCGFSLYIYSLFLVDLIILCGALGYSLASAARALAPMRRRVSWVASRLALFAGAFGVGWAPKIRAILRHTLGTHRIDYGLAPLAQVRANAELLATRALPAFLGVNPAQTPELAPTVGAAGLAWSLIGILFVLLLTAAWLAVFRRGLDRQAEPRVWRNVPVLLGLLVGANLVFFVLSKNPRDELSNRYLLPCVPALAVLSGGFLARLGAQRRLAAALLAALLFLYPAVQTALWYRTNGALGPGWRPVRMSDPTGELIAFLRREDVRVGYGSYWISYLVNMRSGGDIALGLFRDWDRDRRSTQAADASRSPAYIFFKGDPRQKYIESVLEREHRPFLYNETGPYVIYRSAPGTARLLPPD